MSPWCNKPSPLCHWHSNSFPMAGDRYTWYHPFPREPGELYDTFGVHMKWDADSQAVPTLTEAQRTIEDLDTFLSLCSETVNLKTGREGNTNSPEGPVSNKVKVSTQMMWGTDKTWWGSSSVWIRDMLLVCSAEIMLNMCSRNLHAATKYQHPMPTVLEYAHALGGAMPEHKECLPGWWSTSLTPGHIAPQ